jgi:hypothetical protein
VRIIISINKAIDSSIELRNKKELIEKFISTLTIGTNVSDDWQNYVEKKKIEILQAFRPKVGGVYHEASVLVWRPIKARG